MDSLATLIAELRGQPGSDSEEFSLCGEAAHGLLMARGATNTATSYLYPNGNAYVIETARMKVDGVRLSAWFTRPPTGAEHAAAAEGRWYAPETYQIATVTDQAGVR